MRKGLIGLVAIIIAVGIYFYVSTDETLEVADADCGDVSIAAMGWDSGASITALTTFVLEVGYGCNISSVPSDTIPAVTSLAENGQPDIVPELWRNAAQAYGELEASGKVITASEVFASGGVEGWYIPTYLAEENPELTTIDGILANPEKVGSRFHNCPLGWGCRIINDHLKVVHQLEANGIEVFDHGSGANLGASIAAAFDDEAPWFGYYWDPSAVFGRYELTRIDIGPVDPEQHAINATEGADTTEIGVSDYPPSSVMNVITADLEAREPEVAAFIKNMSFPNDVISAMLLWKDNNNASADEAAAWILSNHKDLILSWVNDSAKEKLEARL
jgi:glycine betaine/proline transport system substrate-binding protein